MVGQGSFGSVWRARDTELRREVAIKLMRPGLRSRDFLARFRVEQQMLAALRHPNIATLYGGGVAPPGRPYFAMEFVEGAPITRFCDRERLDIPARLRVFLDVCKAVQFAHTNNIAHRDLKPGNVIVEFTRDRGIRPVVIDFGIAKALAPGAEGDGFYSSATDVVGTPEYMSPEQATPTPHGVDNRTDVYALGVILYELLAGARPFDFSGLLSTRQWSEVQRILRDVEPPAPSTRLSTIASANAAEAERIARARRIRLESLAGALSRELQWIPLMAMKKERSERYGTVQEFADDVQRYLDGFPVRAAPNSMVYRAGKFIRRNRITISVGASIVVLAGASIALGISRRFAEASRAAAEDRAVQLSAQRDTLRTLAAADFDSAAAEAATTGRQIEIFEAAKRSALAWQRFCDARGDPVPGSANEAVERADLASDLLSYGRAALQVARVSSSNRLNSTGLGDKATRDSWIATAHDILARLEGVAPGSVEERALAVMCARSRLDDSLAKRDYAATITEGERVLQKVVSRLPGDTDVGEAARDAGLVRTVLADAYDLRALQLLADTPKPVDEIKRLRARALELRLGEVERRRARAESAKPEAAARARRDLAVVLEKLAFAYRDPSFRPLWDEEVLHASEAASTILKAEYFSRFIASMRPGADIGELHEYIGGEIRFFDFDLAVAEASKGDDPARFEAEAPRYVQAIERAVGVYLETMLRDTSNVRSFEQLAILMQRCLTPARALPRSRAIALIDQIDRVAIVPLRDRRIESIASPDVAARILALRIGVDARRALFLKTGSPDERELARQAAQRSLTEAATVLASIVSKERDLTKIGKDHRVALLAELELAVALGRQLGLPGVGEASGAIEALKIDPLVVRAFSDRPSAIYFWFDIELRNCTQAAK